MYHVTPWTENEMKDVTDADLKCSGTKLVVSKVQGRSRPFDESSGTSLSILPIGNVSGGNQSLHANYEKLQSEPHDVDPREDVGGVMCKTH
jgi:hypothetical protein